MAIRQDGRASSQVPGTLKVAQSCASSGYTLDTMLELIRHRWSERRQRRQARTILNAISAEERIPGEAYLDLVWQQQNEVHRLTSRRLPHLGRLAPKCYLALGETLSLIDLLASCFWQCSEDDHATQHLIGSSGTACVAALHLALIGRYDEALTLIRNAGERVNLLTLFAVDRPRLLEWRSLPPAVRRRKYGPVKVRQLLDEEFEAWPIDNERYEALSGLTHPHDDRPPQTFNRFGRPVATAIYQEAGFLVTLNEAALATALLAAFAPVLLKDTIGRNRVRMVQQAGRRLAETIGAATITEIEDFWGQVGAATAPDQAER
jgi:hypothetical protein